jgi:DNA adenine methylase
VKPRSPAIRYYGGKWRLAPWIISHFPQHETYVEPCGGAASVLIRKPPVDTEVYNDLDSNVYNYFLVLRDKQEELVNKLMLTPWSREELAFCINNLSNTDDPIEKARRFWVVLQMSIKASLGEARVSDFRTTKRMSGKLSGLNKDAVTKNLLAVSKRLVGVQIENTDAFALIEKFASVPKCLIYFDPPYVPDTRVHTKRYAYEWPQELHKRAADLLKEHTGYVVVSGYPSELYEQLYENDGWVRVDKLADTMGQTKRTECLWLSPKTYSALGQENPIQSQML